MRTSKAASGSSIDPIAARYAAAFSAGSFAAFCGRKFNFVAINPVALRCSPAVSVLEKNVCAAAWRRRSGDHPLPNLLECFGWSDSTLLPLICLK